jgi:hypothetical protein
MEPVVIALARPAPANIASHDSLALVESRWLLRSVVKEGCALRFVAQGYGDGSFTWSGARSSRYTIAVDRADREVWRQTAEPDNEGRLKFVLPVSAVEPVAIRIDCADGAQSGKQ